MPVGLLVDRIVDGAGHGVPGLTVIAIPRPLGATRISDGSDISAVSTVTAADGSYQLALEQDGNMSPADSYWEIDEQIPLNLTSGSFGVVVPNALTHRINAVRMPDSNTYNINGIRYPSGSLQATPNAPPATGFPANMVNTGAASVSAVAGGAVAVTIAVQVTDSSNQPVPNDPITFSGGPGPLGGTIVWPNGTQTYTVNTDATGTARVTADTFTAGATADSFNIVVTEGISGLTVNIPAVIAAAPPLAPTNVAVVQQGSNGISVSLTPPAGVIDGYSLLISQSGTTLKTITTTPTVPIVYTDATVLVTGQTYGVQVAAHGAGGLSPYSSPAVSITIVSGITAPSAPTITSVTAPTAGAQLTAVWTAPTSNGGAALSSYTLTASPGGATITVAATLLTATLTGLTNGTTYTLTVTATNASSLTSSPSAGVTGVPATFPGAATGVAGTSNASAQSVISWSQGAANGSAITSQLITIYQGGVASGITQSATGTATSATVTGLTNNVAYTATVTETNGQGTGPESAQSAAFTPQWAAPTVTATSPTHGALGGGTSITLTGTNFIVGSTTVDINGIACTSVVVSGTSPSTSLTCTTGNGTSLGPGAYDINVTTPGGTGTLTGGYTYDANANVPVMTSVNVRSGPIAGGTAIILTGSNFVNGGAVTAITVCGVNQPVFTVNNDTTIHLNTPVAPANTGEGDIIVSNAHGPSATVGPCGSGDRFQYLDAVYITSISATLLAPGAQVTITGSGFTGATAAHVGAATATFSVTNNTTAVITIPAGHALGKYHITITSGGVTSAQTCHDLINIQNTTPTQSIRRLTCPEVAAGSSVGGPAVGTTKAADCQVQNFEDVLVQPQQVAGDGFTQGTREQFLTIPQLKAINPASFPLDLRVGLYVNGGHFTGYDTGGPPPGWWPTPFSPPTNWFLYDSAGNKTYAQNGQSAPGLALLNPQSTTTDGHAHAGPGGWRKAVANGAKNVANNPYDFIFFDVMGEYSVNSGASVAGNPPIDPTRGGVYTAANYVIDQSALSLLYGQAGIYAQNRWMCNGLETANHYLGAPNNQQLISNANGLKSGMFEIYMKDAGHQPIGWPGVGNIPSPNQFYGNTTGTYAQWYQALDDAFRVQNCYVTCYCKLYTASTPSQDDQWMRIALAMFLLAYQGVNSGSLAFQTNAAGGTADFSGMARTGSDGVMVDMAACQLGQPVGLATVSGNVFYRQFEFGYVFLNTDITGGVTLLAGQITSGTKHNTPIALPTSTQGPLATTGWTDIGPKIVYDTTKAQYPAADYPAGHFLGTQNYADGSTPVVPPNNALILKNY